MLVVGLLVLIFICALNWLKWHISAAALMYFIQKKGYSLPDDGELKDCTSYVAKRMISDRRKKD